MSKSVRAILLLVVLVLSINYAFADSINLSTSTTEELERVRDLINAELERRKAAENTKEVKQNRYHLIDPITVWVNDYDFESIIKAIDAGDLEIGEACASDVRAFAEQAMEALDFASVEKDPFTERIEVKPTNLSAFGEDCQAYPYLDEHYFQIVIGFPYDTAIHYTDVYWKSGSETGHTQKSSSKFKVEFEQINGKTWEYSILTAPYGIESDVIEAVSFRDSKSVQRYDYTLSDEEQTAVKNIRLILRMWQAIQDRIRLWASEGE